MKSVNTRRILKVALILLALLLNYDVYRSRINDLDSFYSLILYVVLFSFFSAALFLTAFSSSKYSRYIWGAILLFFWIAHDSYVKIMGGNLTYASFVQLYESRGFAQQAIIQYLIAIFSAVPAGLLLFFGITISPDHSGSQGRRPLKTAGAVAPAVAVLFLSAILFFRGGHGSNGLPSGFLIPAFANLLIYEKFHDQIGVRLKVAIPRTNSEKFRGDIVLIVDESIRGDYLDINNEFGAHSGLRDQPDNAFVGNYGLAVSATNCSVGSNLVMRFGGTRSDYYRYINTMPSIWDYAKEAGLETIYIDGQSEDQLYNGMTEEEISKIQKFIQFRHIKPLYRDIEVAKSLSDLINDTTPQFILVNKLGAHFPINDKFPDDYKQYTPVLTRGNLEHITIGRLSESFDGEWELYKNSYKNVITWSIGRFFEILLDSADVDRAIIIYTSDHGQNFHERGEPGLQTHCSVARNPSMEEGLVPLVLITGKNSINAQLHEKIPHNFNRASHYNIFPTILQLMGYEINQVKKLYGQPLSEPVDDPFTFNVRFYARLGQKPVWKKVDLDKVIGPESSGRDI